MWKLDAYSLSLSLIEYYQYLHLLYTDNSNDIHTEWKTAHLEISSIPNSNSTEKLNP